VAEKLIIVATGSFPAYTDRDEIDEIVSASSRDGYGLRSILHAVVNSDIFRSK
jgi:hypothetical protein